MSAIRDFLQQGKPGETLTSDGNGGLVWAGPMENESLADPAAWSETLRLLKMRGGDLPPSAPIGKKLSGPAALPHGAQSGRLSQ